MDQRRSLDLLQQFIEARTGDTNVSDLSSEAVRLDEWRALLAEHQDAITRFDAAKKEVARLLRERNKHLGGLLADRISEGGFETKLGGARGRAKRCRRRLLECLLFRSGKLVG